VDPHDTGALMQAMQAVLVNPDLRAALQAKGEARAACFSWEETARKTIEVYQGLASQP
jgi:glycosyltransferase involved in cell wall biosynthesis